MCAIARRAMPGIPRQIHLRHISGDAYTHHRMRISDNSIKNSNNNITHSVLCAVALCTVPWVPPADPLAADSRIHMFCTRRNDGMSERVLSCVPLRPCALHPSQVPGRLTCGTTPLVLQLRQSSLEQCSYTLKCAYRLGGAHLLPALPADARPLLEDAGGRGHEQHLLNSSYTVLTSVPLSLVGPTYFPPSPPTPVRCSRMQGYVGTSSLSMSSSTSAMRGGSWPLKDARRRATWR